MALRRSQGLLNKMLGLRASITAICAAPAANPDVLTLATGSPSTVTRTGGSFITDGFVAGDQLLLFQPTSPGNKTSIDGTLVAIVAALTLTLADAVVATGEAFIPGTVLAAAQGGSMKDIMKNGVIRIYSGAQPATPEAAVIGTLLLEVTVASGAFAHDAEAYGLEFGDPVTNYIEKCADEVWSGVGLAAGTAGWFRFCANPNDDGSLDTDLPRIDGTVGISGADAAISNTQIAVGATYTLDTMKLTAPMQYGA